MAHAFHIPVYAQTATLEFNDGSVSGNLYFDRLIDVVLEPGNKVRVHDGKYDQDTGTIKSVAKQSCKLVMDTGDYKGDTTGNIKIFQIELLPDEAEKVWKKKGKKRGGKKKAAQGGGATPKKPIGPSANTFSTLKFIQCVVHKVWHGCSLLRLAIP